MSSNRFPPIANLGMQYVNGCLLSWVDTTHVTVALGQCRNSDNVNDIVLADAVTINTAAQGAGGLDTGTIAANTMYAVYALGQALNRDVYSATISTDEDEPVLYNDWNIYRKVGHVLTDGSSNILPFIMTGDGLTREYWYNTLISELAAGAATSFTDINMASSVPAGAKKVYLQAELTPNSAGNQAKFRTNGSSSTNGSVQISGVVASQVQRLPIAVQCDEDGIIEYLVSSASDALTVSVAGYQEIL